VHSTVARELVWTTAFNGISAYNLDTGAHRVLIPSAALSFGVAADPSHKTFHFTTARGIYQTGRDGSPVTAIHNTPFETTATGSVDQIIAPHDVAIDELTGDLYWGEALYNVDTGADGRGIRRLDADTGAITEVVDLNDGTYPYNVTLAPRENLMVFGTNTTGTAAEAPVHGRVYRSTMDGDELQLLYETSYPALRGVSVDAESQMVFWGERNDSVRSWRIMSGSLDGSLPPELVLDSSKWVPSNLEDIFYHVGEDKLYFGTGATIGRVNPDGTDAEYVVREHVTSLLAFTIFDDSLALVPEPSAAVLGGIGAGIFVIGTKRRRRRHGDCLATRNS
jgi:hypothetical protein